MQRLGLWSILEKLYWKPARVSEEVDLHHMGPAIEPQPHHSVGPPGIQAKIQFAEVRFANRRFLCSLHF